MTPPGITIRRILHSPQDALARLRAAVAARQMTLFAQIDHAQGALEVGLQLRPTTLVIFGAPRAGTLLMQREQLMGLDLPLRILVTHDASGETVLAWHDLRQLSGLYGLGNATVLAAMSAALAAIVEDVAGAGVVS